MFVSPQNYGIPFKFLKKAKIAIGKFSEFSHIGLKKDLKKRTLKKLFSPILSEHIGLIFISYSKQHASAIFHHFSSIILVQFKLFTINLFKFMVFFCCLWYIHIKHFGKVRIISKN